MEESYGWVANMVCICRITYLIKEECPVNKFWDGTIWLVKLCLFMSGDASNLILDPQSLAGNETKSWSNELNPKFTGA